MHTLRPRPRILVRIGAGAAAATVLWAAVLVLTDRPAAVRRRQPEAVSEIVLRQFEARAEIARLRAALWEDPSFRRSPIEMMQMQIDQLADLVIDTTDAVDAAPTINRR